MKKEFRIVDEKKGIIQITTTDERWYSFEATNKLTGLPEIKFLPSVTWIVETGYVKGLAFYKWLANKGWNEAEALKVAAGDKGSKIHSAIGELLDGKTVKMDSVYLNPTTDKQEELTIEEYEAVLSFARWYEEDKPKILAQDFVVINKRENYAGTVDFVCEIDGQKWLIDFKSSQYIWPSHELQVSAYKRGKTPIDIKLTDCKLGILQVGYHRNRHKYKFTEIEDKYDEFLAAKVIWANETKGIVPSQKDYPLSITLKKAKQVDTKTESEKLYQCTATPDFCKNADAKIKFTEADCKIGAGGILYCPECEMLVEEIK